MKGGREEGRKGGREERKKRRKKEPAILPCSH